MLVLRAWVANREWLGTGACIWRSIMNCMSSQVYGYRMTAEEKNKEGLLLERFKASMNEFQKASEELSNLTKI